MAIKVPSLDDTTYSAIVDDSRKLIPVYAKEWTDHNAHDPGITFLELLAWMAESQMFELDQITEAHYLKFMKLMGFTPHRRLCASVGLTFMLPPGAQPEVIPAGTTLATLDGEGSELVLETVSSVAVTGSKLERVICACQSGREDNTTANGAPGVYFMAFGPQAEKGSCMYLAFDSSPFRLPGKPLTVTVRLYEENLPPIASHGDELTTFKPSARAAWQYCADLATSYMDSSWKDLDVTDDTGMLYRSGVVTLTKPPSLPKMKLFDYEGYWIRCAVAEEGYEIPPQIESIAINAVSAVHRAGVKGEKLMRTPDELAFQGDTCSGLPCQKFLFVNKPVVDAVIEVAGVKWEERRDLDGSGPDDGHYVLGVEAGEVVFGDGIRGKVPAAGQEVRAAEYGYGGGSKGNVRAGSPWKFKDTKYKSEASNPFNGTGGEDEETFRSALNRLRMDMKVPYSAVTLDDHVYVATHTPGLRFGRAAAMVRSGEVAGCEGSYSVDVVVVPYSPRDMPVPSRGFIDAVAAHMEKHRLITTKVRVIGPRYAGIRARVTVTIKAGYAEGGRRDAIVKALKDFLHPLRGGRGDGWPFGRTVYRSEIYDVIEEIEGVDCVASVALDASGAKGIDPDGNVLLESDMLAYSMDHQVDIVARGRACEKGA